MSNKRIIYKTENGGVAIIIPAPEARKKVEVSAAVYQTVVIPATDMQPAKETQELVTPAVFRDETDEEFLTWIAAKDVPAGLQYFIVDASEIPTDRTFRNAWEI
jgi:hypothetical protein